MYADQCDETLTITGLLQTITSYRTTEKTVEGLCIHESQRNHLFMTHYKAGGGKVVKNIKR